jgi:hypothetical protein
VSDTSEANGDMRAESEVDTEAESCANVEAECSLMFVDVMDDKAEGQLADGAVECYDPKQRLATISQDFAMEDQKGNLMGQKCTDGIWTMIPKGAPTCRT